MSRLPAIALVGATNVGKSTLFNRLIGRRRSLVHERPGMTRDRVTQEVDLGERRVELTDTGGVLPGARDSMDAAITEQALAAARASELVFLVVDGRLGPAPVDRHLAGALRRAGTPTVIVVNKLDTTELLPQAAEFYQLGLEDVVAVSAAHGLGVGDLERAVAERIAPTDAGRTDTREEEISLGLIGRPNVGKSSILNRLLDEERVVVSPTPGTTRDAVDTVLRAHGQVFRLVDTAGLRRRRSAADAPESLAMQRARGLIARIDIAVVVMDATAGITTGDIAVAGLALAGGRAVLPVLNKWDLLDRREEAAARFRRKAAGLLKFLPDPTLLTLSALSGQRVRRILEESVELFGQFNARRPTSTWNRALRAAAKERRPPLVEGRPYRLYYAVQTGSRPPEIDLFVNTDRPLPEGYRRFLENRLRAHVGLPRTPLRLNLRSRSGTSRSRGRARA